MPVRDRGDQSAHGRERAVVQAGLDAFHRRAAQHFGGRTISTGGQPRGLRFQRRHGDVDAGCDDPAQILLVLVTAQSVVAVPKSTISRFLPGNRASAPMALAILSAPTSERIAIADFQAGP
jgi:hypothetical protein